MQQIEEMTGGAVASAVASKATYTGSGVAMTGMVVSSDWLSIAGFAIAALGFAVNVFFKMKHDAREEREQQRLEEEHQATMKKLLLP